MPSSDYYIIVMHKEGRFPEIVKAMGREAIPLLFDSREDAEETASRGRGRDGWKATIVKLNDEVTHGSASTGTAARKGV